VGVSQVLARYAVRRAHVLVVEVPGHWGLRMALERDVVSRGWRLSESPADADVLAVCGAPGRQLGELVERVWTQLPGPRVRLEVTEALAVRAAVDGAAERLADIASHRADAFQREDARRSVSPHEGMGHEGMGHEGMGHEGMAPDGIPLAQGGEDRDGLEMDALHLPLGPVLRNWPAGLVLRLTLQGDVVTHAQTLVVDAGHEAGAPGAAPGADPTAVAPWLCDNAASVLALAGWPDGASTAVRVRDKLLEEADDPSALRDLERLRGRVRRSRMLRWSLRGIGTLRADNLDRCGLPAQLVGDVYDRLLSMLDAAGASRQLLGTMSPAGPASSAAALRALPGLVAGLDLAAVRLVVSSLAVDTSVALEGIDA